MTAFLAAEPDREFRPVRIAKRAAAIAAAHRAQDEPNPCDSAAVAGLRDRAMLLLGSPPRSGGSEIVALDVEDLHLRSSRAPAGTRRAPLPMRGAGREHPRLDTVP